jgi:hypothetical protein
MSWYKKIDKKLGGWLPGGVSRKPTPAPTPTKRDAPLAPGQQGPVRPQPVFQGPVRPGTDEKTFRETGRSIPSSGGGSRRGGGSSGKGARVSGPLPAGTTPAQEQEFRETGFISTPIVPTASTSVTQVKDKEAGTPSPSIYIQDPTKPRISTPEITRAESARDVKFFKQGFWDSVRLGSFKFFGDVKRDTPVPGMIKTGTLSTDPMTGQLESPFVTYGEREREISEPFEIEQLTTRIGAQARVDAGEDIDKVTEEYRKSSSSISKEQQKALSSAGVIDLYSRPAQEDLQKAGQVAKIGATVGAFAISPVLGAGVLTAEGVWKTTKRADTGDAFTETLFAGRADLMDEKDRTFFSPMEQQFKATRTEGGIALLGGAVGFAQVPFKIGKEITQLRFDEGIKSKGITSIYKVGQVDDKSVFLTKSLKKQPFFSQDTRFAFTTTPKTDTTFSIGLSKGQSRIQVVDFMKQIQGYGDDAIITLDKSFVFAGKGFQTDKALLWKPSKEGVLNVPKVFKQGTSGEGYFTMDGTTRQFQFQSAITKETKTSTFGLGGRVTKVRLGDAPKIVDAYNKPFIKSYISPLEDAFRIKDVTRLSGGAGRNLFGTTSKDGGVINLGFRQQQITQQLGATQDSTVGGFASSLQREVSQNIILQQPISFIPATSFSLRGSDVLIDRPTATALTTLPKQTIFDTRQDTFTGTGLITSTRTGTTSRKGTSTIAPPITTPITSPIQDKIITPIQQPRQDTRLTPITSPSPIGPSLRFGAFTPPTVPLTPFPSFKFPRPFGADAGGGLGKIRATRRFRYTPSFGALALKGQAFKLGGFSTKRFTGLEFRGATPTSPTTTKKKKKKTKK